MNCVTTLTFLLLVTVSRMLVAADNKQKIKDFLEGLPASTTGTCKTFLQGITLLSAGSGVTCTYTEQPALKTAFQTACTNNEYNGLRDLVCARKKRNSKAKRFYWVKTQRIRNYIERVSDVTCRHYLRRVISDGVSCSYVEKDAFKKATELQCDNDEYDGFHDVICDSMTVILSTLVLLACLVVHASRHL